MSLVGFVMDGSFRVSRVSTELENSESRRLVVICWRVLLVGNLPTFPVLSLHLSFSGQRSKRPFHISRELVSGMESHSMGLWIWSAGAWLWFVGDITLPPTTSAHCRATTYLL